MTASNFNATPLTGIKQECNGEVKLKLDIEGTRYTLMFNKEEFEASDRTGVEELETRPLVKVFASAARVVTPEQRAKAEADWNG